MPQKKVCMLGSFSVGKSSLLRRFVENPPENCLVQFGYLEDERELVREAVENDWFYIFTDTEFEPMIQARFAAIKKGFDRIRGRTPRH